MDKNSSICIVGGGPAGLSLAMYLEKNGYNNYRIFERADHVGGKAFSPLMKVKNANGEWEDRTIEMGAVMGCDTYFAVHGFLHRRGTVEKRQYRGESIHLPELPFSHAERPLFSAGR